MFLHHYSASSLETKVVWAGRKELSCQVLKHCGKCCNKKSVNVCVERDVATRMAQVIWPMMIVTVTSFEGFTRQQF